MYFCSFYIRQVVTHTQDHENYNIGESSQARLAGFPTDTRDFRPQATDDINQCVKQVMFDKSRRRSFIRSPTGDFQRIKS